MSVPAPILAILHEKSPATRIAVIGASNDRRKYGWQIVQNLRAKGYDVVPVNPHERSVAGLTAFASVADIKKPIDIKNFVVPPDVSTEVVRALDPDQVRHVWFQPASYDAHMLATAATARAAVARRLADLRRQWIG